MTKQAILKIRLASEISEMSNATIEKRIFEESYIPWCIQILEVAVEEEKAKVGLLKELRQHGLSKTVATNVANFYS